MKFSFKYIVSALLCGFLNGIFGSGGGILVVPLLKKFGLKTKKAHATSVLIILALSLVSIFFYILRYYLDLNNIFLFIPFGLFGSFVGSFFLKGINTNLLRRIFGLLIILSSLRLFFR